MQPIATYRVQLQAQFGFDAAGELAPYLQALGISHLYSSPYLQAAPGSAHGYDVVDPTRVNAELGGAAAHQRLCRALAAHGLAQLLDIVPNHMAVQRENPWWWDVLEHGPHSRYAAYFDVDWAPQPASHENVILMPVLADHYGRVLEAGGIRLQRDGAALRVAYEDHVFPLAQRSLAGVLQRAAAHSASRTLAELADAAAAVSEETAAEADSSARGGEQLARLERLLEADPGAAHALDAAIDEINRDPDVLDALLDQQHYRLACWRIASRELDYRRFFDIDTLVALRVEREEVFSATHTRVIEWLAEGAVDGVRVDHIDGLYDPLEYLRRLNAAAPGARIIVEKILEPGEQLPAAWPVAGTTGYDFLNIAGGLFVDPKGEAPLTSFYATLTREPVLYAQINREKKHLVLDQLLGSDVSRLTARLQAICERHRRYRDYTRRDLSEAIKETIACFPVYRTYVRAREREVAAADRRQVDEAIDAARTYRDDLDPELFDFLRDILLLRVDGEAEGEFAMRFQQLTGPAMAKGVEDTVFYCYNRFVALNEVGGAPERFGVTADAFHAWASETQRRHPYTLLASSTHDTKRSEDVRMRLALLSEIPAQWSEAVSRWVALNEPQRSDNRPDRNIEYVLYQTLVGAWPIEPERVLAYIGKAAREAKQHTSWTRPDADYEAALAGFVEGVLSDTRFLDDLEAFVTPLIGPGRVNSLAFTLIKLTAPGVPDIYQGSELWDLSLVDPDNRRSVDYRQRREHLAALDGLSAEEILARADQGLPKLWVIRQALALRRRYPRAFGADGGYRPLTAHGVRSAHVLGFERGGVVACIVPRLMLKLAGDWQDTAIDLPPGRWRNELSGEVLEGGPIGLPDLLARFPAALLARTEPA